MTSRTVGRSSSFRRAINAAVLFSALVVAPFMAAAHFSAALAGFLDDFADRYLPHSTLLSAEKKAHRQSLARERQHKLDAAREKARTRAAAKARQLWSTLPWLAITPLGADVDPEVN